MTSTETAAPPGDPGKTDGPTAPPITPGTRATALNTIFSEALAHTLRTCSYENFAACFPTPAQHCAGSLRSLWKQMIDRLEAHSKREFDAILSERGVVPALNELDRLIADARRRKTAASASEPPPIAPHTLPPPSHLQAHLSPFLTQQRSHLNARLQTTQSHNARLAETIHEQEDEIRRLLAVLEKTVDDVHGAGSVLGEATTRLGDEAVDVDGAVRS